jgi:hypothetical protein
MRKEFEGETCKLTSKMMQKNLRIGRTFVGGRMFNRLEGSLGKVWDPWKRKKQQAEEG